MNRGFYGFPKNRTYEAPISASYAASASYLIGGVSIDTGSFATTGSNTFIGNQTIGGSVTVTGSFNVSGSTTQIGNNQLLGNTSLSGSIVISGSVSAQADIYLGGVLRLDPAQDPGGTNLTASFLFTSASNTTQGYDLYYRQDGNIVKFKWLEGGISTGLLYGGVISGSGTTIYVSSGSGIIMTSNANLNSEISPQYTYVTWPNYSASAANIATQQNTFIYVDNLGVIHQQPNYFTETQYQEAICLGRVTHANYTSITGVGSNVQTTYDSDAQQSEFIRVFGPIKVNGLTVSGQTGTLRVNVGAGQTYNLGGFYPQDPEHPSSYDSSAALTASMARAYRSGSGIILDNNAGAFYTVIDPTRYDNGSGTLQSVGAGNWSIQRLFFNPVSKRCTIYYGQSRYSSLLNALQYLSTDPFTEGEFTAKSLVFVGYLVLKGNTSDLTDTENTIVQAGLFRNSAGGSGAAGSVSLSLENLSDVTITSPTDRQALIYNAGTWENGTPLLASTASYILNAVSASFASTVPAASLTSSFVTLDTDQTISGNKTFGTTLLDATNNRITYTGATGASRINFDAAGTTLTDGINWGDIAIYRGAASNLYIGQVGTSTRQLRIQTGATSISLAANGSGTFNTIILTTTTTNPASLSVGGVDNNVLIAKNSSSTGSLVKMTHNNVASTGNILECANVSGSVMSVGIRGNIFTSGSITTNDNFLASGSLAGSLLDLSQTWNTTGNPTAIKLNITNTAVGASARLMDLLINGASRFSISSGGGVIGSGFYIGAGSSVRGFQLNGASSIVTTNQTGFQDTSTITQTVNNNYSCFSATPTFNIIGTGITRGFYVAPTLTLANDFRAFESTQGKVILADTYSASGSLSGSLLDMSQTWNNGAVMSAVKLNITNTSSSLASMFMQLQVGGANIIRVNTAGSITFGNGSNNVGIGSTLAGNINGDTTGTAMRYISQPGSTIGYSHWVGSIGSRTPTSGNSGLVNFAETFSSATGTGTYQLLNVAPTISQSASATGITRGIYINPTLTAAADFRALETTQGKVIFGAVSSSAVIITGSLTVVTGSNIEFQVTNTGVRIGNTATDIHQVTGSLDILSGSVTLNTGSITITSGSVTMPNRPAFRVTGSGGGKTAVTILSGSYLGVDYQQGSGWDNTSGTFTAPIAGLYQVNVVVRTNSNSLGTISQLIVYKNYTGAGTGTPQIMVEFGANTTMNHAGGSTISKLAVGDTLKMVLAVGELSFDQNDNFSVAYIG